MAGDRGSATLVVANEFGAVRVSVDRHGNGPRLLLEDLRSGNERFFDPVELEALVWAPESTLDALVDPNVRWNDSPDTSVSDRRWES
jgi:hypothetical protein